MIGLRRSIDRYLRSERQGKSCDVCLSATIHPGNSIDLRREHALRLTSEIERDLGVLYPSGMIRRLMPDRPRHI